MNQTHDTESAAIEMPGRLRGTNQSGMRAHNERLVLSLVRRHGALAKSEISRMTGLSAQTVSVIMRELEAEGLLLRGDPVRGKVGQPSVPMHLNAEGAFFFGLKVGRRSAEIVLTDFTGQVRSRARKTYPYPTPDTTIDFAQNQIERLIGEMPARQRSKVAGLGVAVPHYLWSWAQALDVPQAAMDPWRTVDVGQVLDAAFAFPVHSENDATAACGAELVFGPADRPRDFLYFFVGFFIGGGVVLDGAIYSGRGNAGAIGPLPVQDAQGRVRQLLEVASLRGLERKLIDAGLGTGSMWETADRWDVPEEHLHAWISEAACGLAHAITASSSVIDFEAVKIDGWLPLSARRRLVDEVRAQLLHFDRAGLELPRVEEGTIGPDARALGAASLPLSHRYIVET